MSLRGSLSASDDGHMDKAECDLSDSRSMLGL